jgi:ribose/xylose/arabinose/galactoside ABC-type transport system permease subunit
VSLTNANTIPFDVGFVQAVNAPVLFGFTPVVFYIVLAYALGWMVLSRTTLGLRIYAMGSDPRMVLQAGINGGLTRLLILLVISLFTAIASVVMLGRLGAAAPTAGFGLELDAIVAAIIGGASFRGGSGRLRDTAIGVLFLAILNNGLSGMQMGDAQFYLIKGSLILVALALPALVQLRPSRRG